MKHHAIGNRRDFLKASATGAAGILISQVPSLAKTNEDPGYVVGTEVNPEISNCRVVYIQDNDMVTSNPSSWGFNNQNAAVDAAVVYADMDKLAIALANRSTAADAWATIFQKPEGKNWADVAVAFKINGINTRIMTRIAIIEKLADELHGLGVPFANMVIYDGGHGATGTSKYEATSCQAIRDKGVTVANGINLSNIDILVNTAVNKGHGQINKSYTLCMKLHTPSGNCPSDVAELIDRNRGTNSISSAIYGTKTPTVPYRLQLNIVDSIWATTGDQSSTPTHSPRMIIMGTLPATVDWSTVFHVRRAIMNSRTQDESPANECLAAFGYESGSLEWIDAAQYQATSFPRPSTVRPGTIVRLNIGNRHEVRIEVPHAGDVYNLRVYDEQGRLVRRLSRVSGTHTYFWDGRNAAGTRVPCGKYVAVARGTQFRKSAAFLMTD